MLAAFEICPSPESRYWECLTYNRFRIDVALTLLVPSIKTFKFGDATILPSIDNTWITR